MDKVINEKKEQETVERVISLDEVKDLFENELMFSTRTLKNKIKWMLRLIGIQPGVLGYLYIAESVEMCIKDQNYLYGGITKKLYPDVATKYGENNSARIERAIRHCIKTYFETKGTHLYEEIKFMIFGCNVKDEEYLTNANFIAYLVEFLSFYISEADLD